MCSLGCPMWQIQHDRVLSDVEDDLPISWPHLEGFDVCCKLLQQPLRAPAALWWFPLSPGHKQKTHHYAVTHFMSQFIRQNKNCKCSQTGWRLGSTFDSLVVEVTCLLSVLSAPSVSSPVDCPGEVLVFFRSLLDLHWISVSRPASGDEGFTMCVKYLTALYSTTFVNDQLVLKISANNTKIHQWNKNLNYTSFSVINILTSYHIHCNEIYIIHMCAFFSISAFLKGCFCTIFVNKTYILTSQFVIMIIYSNLLVLYILIRLNERLLTVTKEEQSKN